MKHLIIGLSTVCLLVSCETIIEIDPPDYDKELTVLSYFNHDSTWAARVSQTMPIGTAQSVRNPFLEDAKVTVWDGDRLVDELIHDGNEFGWYESPANLRPKVGIAYTMKVEANGFRTAIATSAIPTIPEYSGADHEQVAPDRYEVSFKLHDPPEDSFYSFNTYLGYPLISSDGGQPHYVLELLFMERSSQLWHCNYVYAADPLPDFEDGEDICLNGVMTDRLFNGQTQEMEFDVLVVPDEPLEDAILIVVINSLSHGFFEYKRTIQLDDYANPFSEAVQVYSNFENGRGVFAGFSTNYVVFSLAGVG